MRPQQHARTPSKLAARRRAAAARRATAARLGEGGLWPVPRAAGSRRPKWMRRARYSRIMAEIDRLDGEAIARAVYR